MSWSEVRGTSGSDVPSCVNGMLRGAERKQARKKWEAEKETGVSNEREQISESRSEGRGRMSVIRCWSDRDEMNERACLHARIRQREWDRVRGGWEACARLMREREREVGPRMNERCTTRMELMSGINIESSSALDRDGRALFSLFFIYSQFLSLSLCFHLSPCAFYPRPLLVPVPARSRARLVACSRLVVHACAIQESRIYVWWTPRDRFPPSVMLLILLKWPKKNGNSQNQIWQNCRLNMWICILMCYNVISFLFELETYLF